MNKTININLGGIFFHVDEIAYQKLKLYLDAIRRSLSDDPQGRDEILNDIELRIGELLSERIKDERQVVNENDIDEITKIMGKPEDYLVDEEIFDDEPKYRSRTSSKKLFRDVDDKFLGGVCAGLAHYFGIEVLWTRLLFVLLVLLSFGVITISPFIGISFFPIAFIYILLWILIPQATTTSEKLQMKGEPVNISNIEKKIREEFQDVSTKVKDGVQNATEKVKNSEFKKKVGNKTKSGIQEILDSLGSILITFFKIIGKIIGAFLIIIAAAALILLIIGAFSLGSFEILGFGDDFISHPPFFYDSVLPTWLLITFTFIATGIPFVVLFMLGLKILSNNVKSFSSTTKLSLLGIWIISILGLTFAGINFAAQTAHEGVFNQTETLPFVANDTIKVKMIGDENLSKHRELRRRYSFETVYDNDIQKFYSTRINLDIKTTDKQQAFVKIRRESQGKNRKNANSNAESIEYQFNLDNQNMLLNGYFLSDSKNMLQERQIDITIYIPVNTVIYLDASTRTFLDDVDNIQGIYDRDMPKHYYKMSKNGLECLDCEPAIYGEDYKKENEHFKLNIDSNGVEIKVNDGENNAEIKINENGVKIE